MLLVLALTYVPDPALVMRRWPASHEPAVRVVIVDLLPHDRDDFRRQLGQLHRGFSEEQIRSLLTDAGFADIMITPLPPEPNATGPALFLATGSKS